MKSLKIFLKRHTCHALTLMLTWVLTEVATRGCYFVFYQPSTPEKLKNFSKTSKQWNDYIKS